MLSHRTVRKREEQCTSDLLIIKKFNAKHPLKVQHMTERKPTVIKSFTRESVKRIKHFATDCSFLFRTLHSNFRKQWEKSYRLIAEKFTSKMP